MKVTGVVASLCMIVCVALAQNNDFFNFNRNWDPNNNNFNDWNGFNSNNFNGLNFNRNNWNGFNYNRNNWNGFSNMNNGLNNLMNNLNMLNTNMRNINGGRDDPVRLSEGILDDARAASAKDYYITEPAHSVTVISNGDMAPAHDLMMSSSENVMIVASGADDQTEGHVIVAGGDNIGMIQNKKDV